MQYPVNEMFQTIQGEAHFTGTPSVFVRLQGCHVACPWCDTKRSWDFAEKHPDRRISMADMIAKTADAPTFALMSATDIVLQLNARFKARHVVITGGEPCLHDLNPLSAALIETGRTVQVETSGSVPINVHSRAWVTVSPKINMPGSRGPLPASLHRADEIKFPVGKPADIAYVREHIEPEAIANLANLWLQPLSTSEKATQLCIEAATEFGWRLSIQTHKFIGVR